MSNLLNDLKKKKAKQTLNKGGRQRNEWRVDRPFLSQHTTRSYSLIHSYGSALWEQNKVWIKTVFKQKKPQHLYQVVLFATTSVYCLRMKPERKSWDPLLYSVLMPSYLRSRTNTNLFCGSQSLPIFSKILVVYSCCCKGKHLFFWLLTVCTWIAVCWKHGVVFPHHWDLI